MGFLTGLAAKILEWLLTKFGHALYEWVCGLVEKHKRDVAQKKAANKLNEDIVNKVGREETKKDETDFLNS